MTSNWIVLNTKFVKLINIYNCCFGQLSIWESLDGSNLWFLNFDAYKLVFGTLDCLKLKSFEYQVCSAHQDIQLLFGQLFIWESLDGLNLWFLNFDAYKLVFRTLDCLKLKSFEYLVCSSHQYIQLLFWSTFHLRKFRWFKFMIFKFRRLQTSFRNPRLFQIEKFWILSLFNSSRSTILI